MCAWLRSTASSVVAFARDGAQFRSRSSFSPWKRPQSSRIRRGPSSSRCWEPVTVPAAPRNVSVALTYLPALRLAHARRPLRKHTRPGRKVENLFGGAVDTRMQESREIEPGLGHQAFLPAHPRSRMLGHE